MFMEACLGMFRSVYTKQVYVSQELWCSYLSHHYFCATYWMANKKEKELQWGDIMVHVFLLSTLWIDKTIYVSSLICVVTFFFFFCIQSLNILSELLGLCLVRPRLTQEVSEGLSRPAGSSSINRNSPSSHISNTKWSCLWRFSLWPVKRLKLSLNCMNNVYWVLTEMFW